MNELLRVGLLLAGMNAGSVPAACCRTAVAAPDVATDAFATARPDGSAFAAPAADAWLGSDKVPHFWMSYATTAFTFAAVSAAGGDRDAALGAGIGAGAVAGIGKEVHDWRRGWTFSMKDLVVDAVGVAAAYFFLREVR
jgi:uncharacterized protein YfiM (DUF2279 family)